MKIGLAFRNELTGIPGGTWVVEQFDQLVAGINAVWKREHNDNGTHSNITASTGTFSGAVETPRVALAESETPIVSLIGNSSNGLMVLTGDGVPTTNRASILALTIRLSGSVVRFGSTTESTSVRIVRNVRALDFFEGFTGTTRATLNAGNVNGATGTFDTAVVIGAATTSGARLDLESGVLAVREGDDSADAPMRTGTHEVTGDLYTVALTDYSATSTIVGWTTPTAVIKYKKLGKLVFVAFRITGTSNATTVTFTLPYTSANNGLVTVTALGSTSDNGASAARGSLTLPANSSTVTCNTTADGAWTAANTKIVGGQFWYEAA